MSTLEKIEKAVVDGYKKMEDGVVDGYKKIEDGVVEGYKKIEDTVVGGFNKMADGFVEKHLMKEGETVEEARKRIVKETAERTEKTGSYVKVEVPTYNHEEAMKTQKEMIEKSIEASKNAGKR